ncbi:SHOCT domain-containing protein [Halopiger xanaduensis]|nr:SHOCT domain-containing protein [Halopiger xanaduensis]
MATNRSRLQITMPAAAVIIALIAAFVALAVLESSVAILVVIFGFIFGGELLDRLAPLLEESDEEPADETDSTPEDALERLRTRYADGDLSDAEFERRLETLVETETIADVERYLAQQRETERAGDRDVADAGDRELERSSG